MFRNFILTLAVLLCFNLWTTESNITFHFPKRLSVGDVVEWKGVLSHLRRPAVLRIFTNGSQNEVVFLQIQGNRSTLRISPPNRNCRLGRRLIASNQGFRLIIRFEADGLKVYMNKHLRMVYKFFNRGQKLTSFTGMRVYGPARTNRLGLLSTRMMAEELNIDGCGTVVTGKIVPPFCPRTDRQRCRVVGGKPATPGQNPWQAAIRKKRTYAANSNPHVCGATLIGSCLAVTAAHCFASVSASSLRRFVVRVGDYYNRDGTAISSLKTFESSQDLEIDKVISHPSYSSWPTAKFDIALIKLKECPRFNDFVRPACLPRSMYMNDPSCGISGWGASNETQDSTEYPSCLQTAELTVKPYSVCKAAYTKSYHGDTMLCAADPCVDSCQGDSGGPLMCKDGPHGKYTLWGITSFGKGCANPEHPGVYTRVSSFIKFLYLEGFLQSDIPRNIRRDRYGFICYRPSN